MRKIKLFPAPHLELRVSVSDEMIKDYRECIAMAEELDGKDCEPAAGEKLNLKVPECVNCR